MKKLLLNPWTALLTLSLMLLIRCLDPSFVESVRLRYFDQLVTSQPTKEIEVNVVNIDEATLDKYGQYPFSRDIYAEIIRELYKRDAGLVVFNILMPEKDRFKQDGVLAKILEKYSVILPSLGSVSPKNTAHGSPANVIGSDPHGRVVEFPGLISNVDILGERAAGVGIVNTFPEVDGVVRRTPLAILSMDQLYPSLSLEVLRVLAGDTSFQIKITDIGVEAVRIPKFGKITTDSLSRVWIDWSQQPKQHSFANLPKSFNKEVVIVGVSAAGLVNPIATSKGEIWPQDLQASALGTMLSGTTIQRPDYADGVELTTMLIAGLLLVFLTRWMYIGIAAVIALVSIGIGGSFYAYSHLHVLWDATAFTTCIILVALHAYTVKFLIEFFQKQQIKKQFGTYMSPDMVARLIKDPSLLKLGGTEQELTISFTDVRGFTSISEHYGRDVEGLTKIMNRYMTSMCKSILSNGGTLDKFIGDAIMFFFNAPLDNRKHCKDAVKAALEMLDNLKVFNDEIELEGVPAFGMGIGINTGVVVVGNMGSEQRFDYTCLGDAVNLASRLEGQSKNYGVLIVLGPVTTERLDGEYFTIELDKIAVKGKKEGVNIHTVFYNPTEDHKELWEENLDIHNEMLVTYRKQDWNKAVKMTNALKGSFDGKMDHYYDIWLERIEEMREKNLPDTWDGTYVATSK